MSISKKVGIDNYSWKVVIIQKIKVLKMTAFSKEEYYFTDQPIHFDYRSYKNQLKKKKKKKKMSKLKIGTT